MIDELLEKYSRTHPRTFTIGVVLIHYFIITGACLSLLLALCLLGSFVAWELIFPDGSITRIFLVFGFAMTTLYLLDKDGYRDDLIEHWKGPNNDVSTPKN